MTGIFSLTDVRRVMYEPGIGDLQAEELATEDVSTVTPETRVVELQRIGR